MMCKNSSVGIVQFGISGVCTLKATGAEARDVSNMTSTKNTRGFYRRFIKRTSEAMALSSAACTPRIRGRPEACRLCW